MTSWPDKFEFRMILSAVIVSHICHHPQKQSLFLSSELQFVASYSRRNHFSVLWLFFLNWWEHQWPLVIGHITGHFWTQCDRSRSRFLVKMTSLKNMTMFMTFRNPDFTFNRLNPSPVDDKRQGRGVWMEAGRYEGRAVVLTAHPPSLTDQMPDGCC